ncbi:hypothetical protein QLX08_010996 [Tetragonisca angustula]|uniref:Uncharacterized protein n=1 Tax=Tetragonisca angustula TaxID=166442 RepID=A0AAW0ZAD5_9HYME
MLRWYDVTDEFIHKKLRLGISWRESLHPALFLSLGEQSTGAKGEFVLIQSELTFLHAFALADPGWLSTVERHASFANLNWHESAPSHGAITCIHAVRLSNDSID